MRYSFLEDGMVSIHFSEEDSRRCIDLASQTHDRYGNKHGYYLNLASSHVLGRAGEFAVAYLLSLIDGTVISLFSNPDEDSRADIIFGNLQIDVKTWNDTYWSEWGRCISIRQYPHLKAKASHIVWCSSDAKESVSSWTVKIRGWNTIDEIASWPKKWTGPSGKQVHNFQCQEKDIRKLDSLIPQISQLTD